MWGQFQFLWRGLSFGVRRLVVALKGICPRRARPDRIPRADQQRRRQVAALQGPRGFSLLEVILALAILAGSIAVLGEVSRSALRNAQVARDMAHAQLLCESKLTELVTGIIPFETVDSAPFDETTTYSLDPASTLDPTRRTEPAWLYSIQTAPVDETGLIAVQVTVTRDLPIEKHPIRVSLVRWMRDPLAMSTTEESDQEAMSSGGSGSGSTGGTNGGSSSPSNR